VLRCRHEPMRVQFAGFAFAAASDEGTGSMGQAISQSLHEEAVAHAHLAERCGELTWKHIEAEYTQDIDQIADTLATEVPLAWALARESDDEGSFRFLTGTTVEEIHGQYEVLRQSIEIHGWDPLIEIRQGWYLMTQGVATLKLVPGGETTQGQTVNLFPVGNDGILGELQVGTVGRLSDGRTPADDPRVPHQRLAVLASHDAYREALAAEDVEQIVSAHAPKAAVAIRNYLTDESSLLDANDSAALARYFSELFLRYRVRDVRLVNRLVETWYAFAELHWIVEERAGERRTLEFCTAELSPIDPRGKYWVRTGAGTDPVEV